MNHFVAPNGWRLLLANNDEYGDYLFLRHASLPDDVELSDATGDILVGGFGDDMDSSNGFRVFDPSVAPQNEAKFPHLEHAVRYAEGLLKGRTS